MTQPVTLALRQLGDGSVSAFNFRLIQSFLGEQGPILNTLRKTASRAPGGFDGDVTGEFVIFAAAIVNTGTGIGAVFGVGVDTVSHTSTGVVTVTLTETFPTDTVNSVTLPKYAVAALPVGSSDTRIQVNTCDATTITFNTRNSSGTLTDAHFLFLGAGTLAP